MPQPVEFRLVQIRQGQTRARPHQQEWPMRARGKERPLINEALIVDNELDRTVVALPSG